MNTFVNGLIGAKLSELTSIAIVIVLFSNFFVDELIFQHIFFFSDFTNDIRSFFIPAKRALDYSIVFEFVLGPLTKAIQMKSVFTDSGTGSSDIAFDDLHMTDCTYVVFIFVLVFLDNHIAARDLDFCIF